MRAQRVSAWQPLLLLPLLAALVALSGQSLTTPRLNPTEPAREWSSCFRDLGCINTTQEWYHPVYRPHNPLPSKRHTVKTTFLMYHKGRQFRHDAEAFTATAASVNAVGYNGALPTSVLIHDFTSNGRTGWVNRLAEVILSQGDRNVISVDWESGAVPPYVQAVANARVVGLELGFLLRMLVRNFSVDARAVHLIGHGLGAHVAGYAGSTVPGLGRITGLDPSGPLFAKMPPRVRLDAGDAAFVDVIHSDAPSTPAPAPHKADGEGIADLSGHLDFFPNGGRDQPGCVRGDELNVMKVTRNTVAPGTILRSCSHKRAFKYYIESIAARECAFLAFLCQDYNAFKEGKCFSCGPRGNKCSVMGQGSVNYTSAGAGRYFVQTTAAPPFCSFLYRLELHLAKPPQAKSEVSGTMVLSLVADSGPPISMPVVSKMVMKHGLSQHLVAYHGSPYVSPVVKAQLTWKYRASLTAPLTICLLCDDSLYVNQVVVTSLPRLPSHNETTVALCSCDGAVYARVKSNLSHVFVPCFQETVVRWQTATSPSLN